MKRTSALLFVLLAGCSPGKTPDSAPSEAQGSDTGSVEERAASQAVESVEETSEAAALVARVLPRFRIAGQGPKPAVSALLKQAQALFTGSRFAEARDMSAKLIDSDSNSGYARYLHAASLQKLRLYAEARPHFEGVLKGGPTFYKSYNVFNLYGWCLFHLGDPVGARVAFEAHLEFAPEYDDSHLGLGQVALEGGELERAEGHFRDALRSAPYPREKAIANAFLADVLSAVDRLEEARDALLAALDLHPELLEAHFKLSRVYTRLGDEEAAALHREKHAEALRAQAAPISVEPTPDDEGQ